MFDSIMHVVRVLHGKEGFFGLLLHPFQCTDSCCFVLYPSSTASILESPIIVFLKGRYQWVFVVIGGDGEGGILGGAKQG